MICFLLVPAGLRPYVDDHDVYVSEPASEWPNNNNIIIIIKHSHTHTYTPALHVLAVRTKLAVAGRDESLAGGRWR